MTMRGLARTTGRAPANFYNYFSSKADLLFALQRSAFQNLNSTAERALEGAENPIARLYAFVLNHVRYVAEHRAIVRVLVHEASALPASRRRAVRMLKERYFQAAKEIIASILSLGANNPKSRGAVALDEVEVECVTYSVFGMLNWSYVWYNPRRHGTPQDVARTILSIALYGLVAHCPYRMVSEDMEYLMGSENTVRQPSQKIG